MTEHCAHIAIIGRTNVGKSTLLNRLIGSTIAITCHKSHTTRHRILGILTDDAYQMIFIDSPGLGEKSHNNIQRQMMRTTDHCIAEADIIMFVTDQIPLTQADKRVIQKLQQENKPVIGVINKIDKKGLDIEAMADIQALIPTSVPVSAKKDQNIDLLIAQLRLLMPVSPFIYQTNQLSDQSADKQYAELIREQILLHCHAEVPHAIQVIIEKIECIKEVEHIHCVILAQTPGQKGILIGKQGQQLKQIGQRARLRIEHLINKKVMLKTWVKVDPDWMNRDEL